ncbi:hypothetical protein JXL21_06760 [Candidatus Bathyarchaeota archaeon]|nr:hypothetical protein [Candidatus Bathyarchaeota archaeon]
MVSVEEKQRLIQMARKRGEEYMYQYEGCAQTTMLAVADTLGIEISDDVFRTVAPLSSFTGGVWRHVWSRCGFWAAVL